MTTHSIAPTVAGVAGSYVDLEATFGYLADQQERDIDAALGISGQVEIPSMPGTILVGPNKTAVREFKFGGWIDGASKSAVLTNRNKLKALVTDGLVWAKAADWSTVQIQCQCIDFKVDSDPARHVSTAEHVTMTFRAPQPYWQDVTPQSITFGTSHTDMPVGTAESYPVLTSPVGPLAACSLTGYDYTDAVVWTCGLAALVAAEQYRITVHPGIMTLEKFAGVWDHADEQILTGRFPMPLPSNGLAFQTSTYPKLAASVGTWTADFSKNWK